MASAIICLATNQKFNFSKYIFDNMLKNLEGGVKFLMFLRLVQRKQKTKKPRRKDIELPQTSVPTKVVANEDVYEEMYDSVERAATIATGLDGRNDQDMFDTGVLDDEEVIAEKEVSTAYPVTTSGEVVATVGVEVSAAATTLTISMDDITLAKALSTLKSEKPMIKDPSVPKAKGIVMQEPEETTIRTTIVPS
nr:hypothetical protein [Tanacetum cinerariifolium]